MPEGHTLYRLARDQAARVRRSSGARDEPAGTIRRGCRAARRPRPRGGPLLWQAPLRRLRRRHVARAPGALRNLRGRTWAIPPPAKGALRMRWVADGPDGAGAWTDLRGPTVCEVLTGSEVAAILARLGPDPLRPPDGGGGRSPAHRRAAGRRSAPCSWTSPCWPASATSTGPKLLHRHGVSPFRPGRDVEAEPDSGGGCGQIW